MITIVISKPVFWFLVAFYFVCNYPNFKRFIADLWSLL